MRFPAWLVQRGVLVAVAAAMVVAVAGAFLWSMRESEPAGGASGAFEVVDAAHRELDGSPALALSFSLPLDTKVDAGRFVQVLEMPPRPEDSKAQARVAEDEDDEAAASSGTLAGAGVSRRPEDTQLDGGKPVSGAWVVGDNPRLLYFPHIKPQTRYVVRVLAGMPARGGTQLAAEERFSVRTAAVAPAFYFASRGMVLPAAQNGGLPVTTVNTPEVDIQFLKVRPEQLPRFLDKVVAGAARLAPAPGAGEDEEGGYYYGRSELRGAVSIWQLDELHKMTESAFVGRFLTEPNAIRRAVTCIPDESNDALK